MAGKPKKSKDVSETNEDQDPEDMMIPGTSGTSTTEAKTKTKKNAKKKSGKPTKKPKKSDEQQGKKQTKITEYLANKTEQPEEEIPADKSESQQDQDDEDEDEDLIKNSGITKKSKKMKNNNNTKNKNSKKKSRRILASSDEEEEDSSSQNIHNKSINEFDRIQQQLAQIEMLRAEFSKGPDISEVIGKRAEADDPKQQNQSTDVAPDSDSDSDSEIDLKQYFFKKSQLKRIRNSLRTIVPKPPPAADLNSRCTKNDFLQLFILLDNVPETGNPNSNPNPQDPFNIGRMLFDEKIIDNRTMMLLNLWKCCSTFMKLIETFTRNAVEDGILKIRRSEKESSPEDHHQHHQHRYVNDAQILQQYVNMYALNARKLMINDAAENPESSGSRGGSRSAPLFVYCLLAQEICLKTLKQQKKNRKHDDDRRRSRFIIDLLTTFPTIPDYASTTTTTTMMMMVLSGNNDDDPNDNQIKRNKCCWWLLQLSSILIIGLFDCFQSFHLDLDKFFQQLDLIITLQSRMLDCCCLTNQVEIGVVVPKVLDQHHLDRPSHHNDDDPSDEDDGQVDDHDNDELDQTLSLYLFLLYICLSLKTFYHARDKFGLVEAEAEASSDPTSGSINSVQRSFMVYDHLRSMFGKLFQTFTTGGGGGYNTKSLFRKFYRLVFRWHRLDNNTLFQMDHPNILKSSSSSSQEDRLCIQLIIIIETFSQLMLFLPKWLSKTGEHLHLFWMLFTLIKLKCLKPEPDSGSGQESSSSSTGSDGAEPPTICRTFEQAIQPMIDIVWRELPFGCQIYLVHFISAYITNFGTNPFILNLCKTLFNIPGMDFKFRSMISALSMDI